jgi:serine/threonine protein kinase
MFYASEIVSNLSQSLSAQQLNRHGQIVGISNLHSIGVMHRNINPDDVIFDQSGHVVISNFEFAEFVASSGLNTGTISCDFLTYPRAQCYQAPEILLGWAHDSVVDSWGFGMVLYFMYFGKVGCVLIVLFEFVD